MKNYVQPGLVITLAAPYTVTSGQGALVGSIFGVATGDVTSGADGEFQIEGVFDLAKEGSPGSTFAVGDLVYWDTTAHNAQNVDSSTGAVLIGVCVKATTAYTDATVRVRLNGISVS